MWQWEGVCIERRASCAVGLKPSPVRTRLLNMHNSLIDLVRHRRFTVYRDESVRANSLHSTCMLPHALCFSTAVLSTAVSEVHALQLESLGDQGELDGVVRSPPPFCLALRRMAAHIELD